ncbi:uncharacterized protein HLK63_I01771 [Nakaseomyces glabratus]|nr:hypothetical protein J7298_02802 [Nakaseomyces glabratus]KAH7599469.1 hypothetical protein J7295_02809 [Nakaseomyces glabratus]KAH7612882.1 hypothetical protein J7292_02786 [Nakaseomyces glabratus]UCS21320.1 uncharacterized protein GW608_I01771 [Nakaseomyces glabratus]UCS26551.1 uncharacterized protein HLK63_I01771 [Nakaseomyces glabratus]
MMNRFLQSSRLRFAIYNPSKVRSITTLSLNDLKDPKVFSKSEIKNIQSYWVDQGNPYAERSSSLLVNCSVSELSKYLSRFSHRSFLVRELYRRELIYNSQENPEICQELIRNITKNSPVKLETCNDILAFIVQDSIRTNDVIMAVRLFLLFHKLNPSKAVDGSIIQVLFSALAVKEPDDDSKSIRVCMNILNDLNNCDIDFKLKTGTVVRLIDKVLNLKDNILGKAFAEKFIESNFFRSLSNDGKLEVLYCMIENGHNKKNDSQVVINWFRAKKYCDQFSSLKVDIIHMLLKLANKENGYSYIGNDIIENLEPRYYCNSRLLLPEIIKLVTRTADLKKIQTLLNIIEQNMSASNYNTVWLSKDNLCALLKMYLDFGDSQGVDNTLKHISDTYGRIDAINHEVLISHLLEEGGLSKVKKAISLLFSLEGDSFLICAPKLLSYLLQTEQLAHEAVVPNRHLLVNEIVEKAEIYDREYRTNFWDHLVELYFIKLLESGHSGNGDIRKSLLLAKLIFINSVNSKTSPTYNPFSETSPDMLVVRLKQGNMVEVLKRIAQVSFRTGNEDILQWSCAQLFGEGFTTSEVIVDIVSSKIENGISNTPKTYEQFWNMIDNEMQAPRLYEILK